jgi:hypothetical protein
MESNHDEACVPVSCQLRNLFRGLTIRDESIRPQDLLTPYWGADNSNFSTRYRIWSRLSPQERGGLSLIAAAALQRLDDEAPFQLFQIEAVRW